MHSFLYFSFESLHFLLVSLSREVREKDQAGINLTDVCIERVFCLFRCAGQSVIRSLAVYCRAIWRVIWSALYIFTFHVCAKKNKKKRDKREKEACVRNSTVVVLS
ncbi:hypothetical protein FCM35_KLT06650 [Carex littledalei]|uniref:Secreted protein n=1 Tax=Carex littledalei TaxID=544730 RepID=A0A833QRU5_9POAL|nr:hypothetical protein FCM35_KLT06650 [Carex littledalei]